MTPIDPHATALVVVDVQQAFQVIERGGTPRNNPDAVERIAELLAAFRTAGAAIIHIRHRGTSPGSVFKGQACEPVAAAREIDGEPVLWKTVNSSFIGTDLEARLRRTGIRTVVVCGATTNHCVETTVRMAGNLGFDTRLVADATWTFDREGPDGLVHRAADIQRMSEANLSGEFAEIVATSEIQVALRSGATITS
ncbi:cysteine hydrolase family protein [Alsobacter sp. KACC 23698]|uniref:Cysteine hydrolase family protein n=1 Tax=Alsobacter sp. KACC 23698 TaxID=3149229 RepID=A0AAU7JDN0_9HYPH